MNNKGLYTSAIGILIVLLISANIFVFLGADKSSANGSNVADEIMDVKTSWHKAAFLAENIIENHYYQHAFDNCDNLPSNNVNFLEVEQKINGPVNCEVLTYVAENIEIKCYSQNNNVSYTKTYKVQKSIRNLVLVSPCKFEIWDDYADYKIYP